MPAPAVADALPAVDARLPGLLPDACLQGATLWIGGRWEAAVTGDALPSINPSTGQILMSIARGSAGDVDRAVRAAEAAAPVWRSLDGIERGRILRRCADGVRAAGRELGLLDTLESGRPIAETSGRSVEGVARLFDFYAGLTDKIRGATVPVRSDATAMVEREPYGVVGAISPWNYPLSNVVTKIAPILACGNAMVLKPAELTSLAALRLATVLAEAGLPPGVLNIVTGGGADAGAALVDHPGIRLVSFTGSTETGRLIAARAGGRLIPVVLELGGKSAMIVFEDADLEAAARASAFSAFGNAGQTCTACTRLLVARSLMPRFVAMVEAEAARLVIGDPLHPDTQVGPLASAAQSARVRAFLADAPAHRTMHLPNYHPLPGGYFHPPVILADLDPKDRIGREEVFGPVLSVFPFDDEAGAIELANDSSYGLAASVWTASIDRAARCRRELDAGLVWINAVHLLHPGLPLGGMKASGLGSEYGMEAVECYTRPKSSIALHGRWQPPYPDSSGSAARGRAMS
ncbi:aldehyde dehydrogenase family protein [Pararoseomonas sp. SCSIO 73927]|uniref:aldehyde dehydrogenase family protein n=1 Tax=Pararoseomonas sp. SCSIO 73927 TaxID=3114537 RepID=UPI0030D083FE